MNPLAWAITLVKVVSPCKGKMTRIFDRPLHRDAQANRIFYRHEHLRVLKVFGLEPFLDFCLNLTYGLTRYWHGPYQRKSNGSRIVNRRFPVEILELKNVNLQHITGPNPVIGR